MVFGALHVHASTSAIHWVDHAARWHGSQLWETDTATSTGDSDCTYLANQSMAAVFDWTWLAHPNTTTIRLDNTRTQWVLDCQDVQPADLCAYIDVLDMYGGSGAYLLSLVVDMRKQRPLSFTRQCFSLIIIIIFCSVMFI